MRQTCNLVAHNLASYSLSCSDPTFTEHIPDFCSQCRFIDLNNIFLFSVKITKLIINNFLLQINDLIFLHLYLGNIDNYIIMIFLFI